MRAGRLILMILYVFWLSLPAWGNKQIMENPLKKSENTEISCYRQNGAVILKLMSHSCQSLKPLKIWKSLKLFYITFSKIYPKNYIPTIFEAYNWANLKLVNSTQKRCNDSFYKGQPFQRYMNLFNFDLKKSLWKKKLFFLRKLNFSFAFIWWDHMVIFVFYHDFVKTTK